MKKLFTIVAVLALGTVCLAQTVSAGTQVKVIKSPTVDERLSNIEQRRSQ